MLKKSVILEASGIGVQFGGVRALQDVSLRVIPGEMLGIIGPNGAGKTTLFNVFSGFLLKSTGSLYFNGHNVSALLPHERSRLGMMRTWQLPRSFRSMTVHENVLTAAIAATGHISKAKYDVDRILDLLGLKSHANMNAADLPPGQRKRLELARTLAAHPKLILLDEVLSGQTAEEVDELFHVLKRLVVEEGLTIVMIEHVIRAVRSLCDRVIVLSEGQILAEGVPEDVIARPEVIKTYIGAAGISGSVAT